MPLSWQHRGHFDGAPNSSTVSGQPGLMLAGEFLVVTVSADSRNDETRANVYTTSPDWGFPNSVWHIEEANLDDGAFVGVYALPAAISANPTVHVDTSGSPSNRRQPSMDLWVVAGPLNAALRNGVAFASGNPFNFTLRSSPGRGESLAVIAGSDATNRGTPYVSGSGVTPGPGFDQPGPDGTSGFGTIVAWTAPDTNQTLTVDPAGGTNAIYALAWIEILPAPDPPIVDAYTDRTVEIGIGIDRTAGEVERGSPVTTREWRLVSGPVGTTPGVLSTSRVVRLPNTVLGAHLLRYTANSAAGAGTDDATITVVLRRPSVNAGPDVAQPMGVITRTATENAYGTAITSRAWRVAAGPSLVGTVIGSAAALSWTPPTLGAWTLSYTATSAAGTSDPDVCVITVGVVGVPLRIGRTPVPRLAVAVAFGGNLSDPDGSDWVFTEVTTDVRAEQGIHLRHGKGDEASVSQPAQMSLTLDNRLGRYSLGGRSPFWPNLRQGTPVQVTCDLGGGAGFETLFTGYADGWTPVYTTRPTRLGLQVTGDSAVSLVASGNLRRLSQGQPPVISPLRRGLTASTGVVAYWPCEDEVGARFLASAIQGHPPMDFSGRLHGGSNPGLPAATPRFAASETFACSGPLPLVSDSEWYGNVPDYTGTEIIQMRCLIDVPTAGSINGSVILGLITTGDPGFWELRYMTGGLINVRAWRNFQSLVLDAGPIALVPGPSGPSTFVGLDGRRGQLGLTLIRDAQHSGNIEWTVDFIESGATTGYVWGPHGPSPGPEVTGTSVGKAQRVQTCTDGGHVDVALGHIVVRKDSYDHPVHVKQLNAWRGETVGERLLRITQENGLAYVQIDPPPPHYPTITDTMGPQVVGTVLDLYRDCERTDGGLLWDGGGGPATASDPTAIGAGLSYTTKRYRESRAPALTLDAALGEVAIPFTPAHDDAYRCNRATASRYRGASAVFEDTIGPLGSGILGRYDDSRQVNCRDDSALAQYAGWMVGQGTVEGYRYPRLSLNLVKNPQLLDEWLAIIPGDRVDVLNLWTIHPAAPVETVRLSVEGFEQTITPTSWDVIMNTSLQRRWSVASVAAETTGGAGDPAAEYVARVDTDGTALAAIASAGQTALTVTVTAGPFWTTRTDDYPLTLDVGAVAVRATACTAPSGAQQTFTVDPMPVTRPAGVRVILWNAPVFGL